MAISGISSATSLFQPLPVSSRSGATRPSASATSAASSATSASSAAVAAATTATPPATATPSSAAVAPAPSTPSVTSATSAASVTSSLLDSTTAYSTRIAGKNYSASVSQANGVYTLSVPNLPGSSVSGSSLSSAELALNVRIDALV